MFFEKLVIEFIFYWFINFFKDYFYNIKVFKVKQ